MSNTLSPESYPFDHCAIYVLRQDDQKVKGYGLAVDEKAAQAAFQFIAVKKGISLVAAKQAFSDPEGREHHFEVGADNCYSSNSQMQCGISKLSLDSRFTVCFQVTFFKRTISEHWKQVFAPF